MPGFPADDITPGSWDAAWALLDLEEPRGKLTERAIHIVTAKLGANLLDGPRPPALASAILCAPGSDIGPTSSATGQDDRRVLLTLALARKSRQPETLAVRHEYTAGTPRQKCLSLVELRQIP
jgi:hypothetical protein